MIDQIRIDHILQIPPSIIRQEHIDRLALLVPAPAALAGDAVVDAVDYTRTVGEDLVGFYLFHGVRYRFLAEGAADFLEREEFCGGGVLD